MRMIGLIIILAFSLISAISPILPKNKSELPYAPPSGENLLGTNEVGNDVGRTCLLREGWWCFVPPGVCIATTTVGFMLLGMALEEKHRRVRDVE